MWAKGKIFHICGYCRVLGTWRVTFLKDLATRSNLAFFKKGAFLLSLSVCSELWVFLLREVVCLSFVYFVSVFLFLRRVLYFLSILQTLQGHPELLLLLCHPCQSSLYHICCLVIRWLGSLLAVSPHSLPVHLYSETFSVFVNKLYYDDQLAGFVIL